MFDNFYKNRTVLITGHTGFKGAWLSLWLNQLGVNVVGYALRPPTKPNLFELCNLRKKISSVHGDVRNFLHLKKIIKKYKPGIIFHLAAQSLVRYSYKNPLETYSTNVMGTANLLEAVRQINNPMVIINVTSDKCYENKKLQHGYREDDSLGGQDPYSSSKGCAEFVTKAYLHSYFSSSDYKKHNISLASVRAGNVIGGGDWAKDRLIPDCITALMKKKTVIIRYPNSVRPWQHVLEPLYGYLLLAKYLYKNGPKFSGAWNFGPEDKSAKSVSYIVDKIIKIWDNKSVWTIDKSRHPYETGYLKLNSSKSKTKLGWHPVWNLEMALEKTIEWYKAYYNHENMLDVTVKQIINYENTFKK